MAEYNSDEDQPNMLSDIETPEASEAQRRVHEARRLIEELEARTRDVQEQLRVSMRDAERAPGSLSAETIKYQMDGDRSDAPNRGLFPQGIETPIARNRECDETDSEVMVQPRAGAPRPASREGLRFHMVGTSVHFKPEPYDGTTDWPEYLVYFEQLAEVHGWDHPTMAMVLGLSLKGSARSVLANLTLPLRRDYKSLKNALTQHFCPPQQIHLYQAELKARKRNPNESLPELGRDIARLIRLAYPTADMATRETIGINSFLDAIPGPAIEVRLNVLRGHPTTILEAVALAMEVDALFEAEASKKAGGWKNRLHMVGSDTDDTQITQLVKTVERLEKEVQSLSWQKERSKGEKRSSSVAIERTETRKCFNCGIQGHLASDCRKPKKPKHQGNGEGWPDPQ